MKKTLTLLALAAAFTANAQIVFQDGFESWTSNLPDNWVGAKTNISTDSIVQVSTNVHGGSYACELRNPGATHKRFTTGPLAVSAGTNYVISFWVRGAGQIRTGLFDGRPGSSSGFSPYNPYVIAATSWVQVTQTVACTNDTTDGEFIISLRDTSAANIGHLVIDDVNISLPGAATPHSIYEVQYTTAGDGSSPYVGTVAATGGIVTAANADGYWLQAGSGPWSGILVNDALTSVSEGDSVTLEGLVEESFGLTRLNNVTNVLVEGGYPVPAAEVLNYTQAQSEGYESVLATVVALTCTRPDAGFGEWVVNYNTTDSLYVDDMIYAYTPTLGASYTLTGPMYYSFSKRKIEPRSAADIVAGISDVQAPAFTVGPNPATTEFTIVRTSTGAIDWSLVDATGRTVLGDRTSDDRISIDVRALQPGTYSVVLRRNGTTTARPLVIAR